MELVDRTSGVRLYRVLQDGGGRATCRCVDSMSPSEDAGKRPSVGIYEVVLEGWRRTSTNAGRQHEHGAG